MGLSIMTGSSPQFSSRGITGAADGFLDKGAFSHGTSRGFLGGRPDLQGMLQRLPPIFRRGTALAQVAGDSPPHVPGGDPRAASSFIPASQGA